MRAKIITGLLVVCGLAITTGSRATPGSHHIASFYADKKNGMKSVGYGDTMSEAATEAKKGCTTTNCAPVLLCTQPGIGVIAFFKNTGGYTDVVGACGLPSIVAANNKATEICQKNAKTNCITTLPSDPIH